MTKSASTRNMSNWSTPLKRGCLVLRFHGRLSYPKFDAAKYTQALEEACETQVRQAAREWLRAVIPHVPVWAGTSRGSLQPLGRFLKVAVPINPTAPAKAMRPSRGPEAGARQQHFKFSRRGRRFIFQFETTVAHFIQNEFYHAPNPPFKLINPTPWNAFKYGEAAFAAYMQNVVPKRIPKIKDYIKFDSRRIGG